MDDSLNQSFDFFSKDFDINPLKPNHSERLYKAFLFEASMELQHQALICPRKNGLPSVVATALKQWFHNLDQPLSFAQFEKIQADFAGQLNYINQLNIAEITAWKAEEHRKGRPGHIEVTPVMLEFLLSNLQHKEQMLIYSLRMLLDPNRIELDSSEAPSQWLTRPTDWSFALSSLERTLLSPEFVDEMTRQALRQNPESFYRIYKIGSETLRGLYEQDHSKEMGREYFEFLGKLKYDFLTDPQHPDYEFKSHGIASTLYFSPEAVQVLFSDPNHPLLQGYNRVVEILLEQYTFISSLGKDEVCERFFRELAKVWVINEVDLASIQPHLEKFPSIRDCPFNFIDTVQAGLQQKRSLNELINEAPVPANTTKPPCRI